VAKTYDAIAPDLATWLREQRLFFVATAPLAADGLLNCSPKGMDTFRVLGPHDVAYLDLTGSGAETIAHLRENGRIVFTFCALSGPPRIVRLYGTGEVLVAGTAEFERLRPGFPDTPGARAIIRAGIRRVGDSCGYSIPRFDFVGERDSLVKWAQNKGPDGLVTYRSERNATSIDGLPALDPKR
jgi:hypothetical protein